MFLWFSVYIDCTPRIAVLFSINNYHLSLTNPRDVQHHGKRAANEGGCSV